MNLEREAKEESPRLHDEFDPSFAVVASDPGAYAARRVAQAPDDLVDNRDVAFDAEPGVPIDQSDRAGDSLHLVRSKGSIRWNGRPLPWPGWKRMECTGGGLFFLFAEPRSIAGREQEIP